MTGYTELQKAMLVVEIFSFPGLNANRANIKNILPLVEGESERCAENLAQDFIKESFSTGYFTATVNGAVSVNRRDGFFS
jgi:hypothetical protein